MQRDKFQLKDVFTPASPAKITFVERDSINNKLVSALQMPGKQIIVYGHSGSGKTTLLVNKLKQLYEHHITTRCMKGLKFDQLLLDAFDQLSPYFTSEITRSQSNSISTDISGSYLAIKSSIQSKTSNEVGNKSQRVLPPQLSPQALGKFLGAAKCCWILEDFHKIDEEEKTQLSQLMKMFMDLSEEYADLKIVALGAVDTASQVVNYDKEMRNRVAEIHVELMSVEELKCIIQKGEEALNIHIDDDLKNRIASYSNGLASVCHHICMYMCNAANICETSVDTIALNKMHFEEALKLYVEESSDSIRSAFDIATKQRKKTAFDNGNLILEALSSFQEKGASRNQLITKIKKKEPKYLEANLKYFLTKLQTAEYGGLIRYNSISAMYSFSDPFYRVYALARYAKPSNQSEREISQIDLTTLFDIISKEFGSNGKFKIKISQ